MNHPQLYLFKTESLNFINLLQFCFILSRDDLYQPCVPYFNEKMLDLKLGQFPKDMLPENPRDFRNIDWYTKIHLLDKILENANSPIVIGNNSIDQIQFLKNRYQNQAVSVSCEYDVNAYQQMLTYKAHQHIYQQSIGIVPLTDVDLQVRKDLTIDLVSYYRTAFDHLNLIPKQIKYNTDTVVPCQDFFDKSKFFDHILNLGGTGTHRAISYYDQWYQHQQSFFTMRTHHENI